MNLRLQKYKKNRLAGMSAYKAAIAAGYSHNTAWNAHVNIEKRCNFQQELIKKGLDNDTIIKVLIEGLEATKVISCNVISPKGDGMKDAGPKTQDFIDVPDYAVRHKFLETLLKLRGDLKEAVQQNSLTVVHMQNIQVGDRKAEYYIGSNIPPKTT